MEHEQATREGLALVPPEPIQAVADGDALLDERPATPVRPELVLQRLAGGDAGKPDAQTGPEALGDATLEEVPGPRRLHPRNRTIGVVPSGKVGSDLHSEDPGPEGEPASLEALANRFPVLASREAFAELQAFRLSEIEAKAIILLSLPGPHRLSDAQVGRMLGRGPSWIPSCRRKENFARALKRSAIFVAWSYFPELVGDAIEMARNGDKQMLKYVLDRFYPDGGDTEALKSILGPAAMKLDGSVVEELHIRRIKPGHHKVQE